jgi:hypothetical protein
MCGLMLWLGVDCLLFYFAMIDTNAAGEEEEGHIEGFEGNVQGHFADQGKPALDAYLILLSYSCIVLQVYKIACLSLFTIEGDHVTPSFRLPPLRVLPLIDIYWTTH